MIRKLNKEDFNTYTNIISQLTSIGDVTQEQFNTFVDSQNNTQQTWVYEFDNEVVASVTILIEQKITRSYGKCMHIEDVVTSSNYRGKGFASDLIQYIINIAQTLGCYKIILNCSKDNVSFYDRLGFKEKELQMSLYLK
jgi:glucosamine-phosphate N-acetyltransferase